MKLLHLYVYLTSIIYNAAHSTGGKLWSFELSVIHLNDFHDRFEEIGIDGGTCKNKNCIGGFSRIYRSIQHLLRKDSNAIVLNGGDNFTGTLWFALYGSNVTQHFFNLLPTDTLGNHEFDKGIEEALSFIKALTAPVVVTNIDCSEEPVFQAAIKKSVVLQKNGKKIGIIGVLCHLEKAFAEIRKLKFLDEIESVNREAKRMVSEDGVDTIILLSHCGYKFDKLIAKAAAPKIGLIVGGHSHTLLHTGPVLEDFDRHRGDYPTVVSQNNGQQVLVVQALGFSKYLGHIRVRYDVNGNVVSWDGNTIYLNSTIPQDETINEEILKWKKSVDSVGGKVLGSTEVHLSSENCKYAECTLGNFVADAMLFDANVTFADLISAVPFSDTYDTLELQGIYLRELLEYSTRLRGETLNNGLTTIKSVSGIRIVYNITNKIGSRIMSIQIRSRRSPTAIYQDLDMNKLYPIIVDSYTIAKDDSNGVLKKHMINHRIGKMDVDVLSTYLSQASPICQEIEGRIIITT